MTEMMFLGTESGLENRPNSNIRMKKAQQGILFGMEQAFGLRRLDFICHTRLCWDKKTRVQLTQREKLQTKFVRIWRNHFDKFVSEKAPASAAIGLTFVHARDRNTETSDPSKSAKTARGTNLFSAITLFQLCFWKLKTLFWSFQEPSSWNSNNVPTVKETDCAEECRRIVRFICVLWPDAIPVDFSQKQNS